MTRLITSGSSPRIANASSNCQLMALAFVPFANSRLWLAVSGLVLIYYLRFWFLYHAADVAIFGTDYRGTSLFDFVIVWLEFAPFLLILGISTFFGLRKGAKARSSQRKRMHVLGELCAFA